MMYIVVESSLASRCYQVGTEYATISADHQARYHAARSAVMPLASRVTSEVHRAKSLGPKNTNGLAYG